METLPPEIHYEIVLLVRESVVSRFKLEPRLSDAPHLRDLSRVSRYWRSLSLPLLFRKVAIDGTPNAYLQYFITTYQPYLRHCKSIAINMYPHSRMASSLSSYWIDSSFPKAPEESTMQVPSSEGNAHVFGAKHPPEGVLSPKLCRTEERKEFWQDASRGRHGTWSKRRLKLIDSFIRETHRNLFTELIIRFPPLLVLEDLVVTEFSALQGRHLHTLILVGCSPDTTAQLICQNTLMYIDIKILNTRKIDRALFPTILTTSTCQNIKLNTMIPFNEFHFPLPKSPPSAPIKCLSISYHISLRHLFDVCSALGSTLETLTISGRLDNDSSPPPVQAPRLHTLGVGGCQAKAVIPLFCHTSVQSIYIRDAGLHPAKGTIHAMLSQGFDTLKYLEIRTGFLKRTSEWPARAVPLHEEMKRRGGKFSLVR